MKTFLTADLHLGHANIIKYCNRPFDDVYEMNEILINNWNNKISKDDEVFVLGDVAFQNPDHYLPCLNGKKFLIIGNHDYRWMHKLEPYFEWCKEYHLLRRKDRDYVLSHYAMRTWYRRGKGVLMLHGHSHGKLEPWPDSLDVGVDNCGFEPISLEEIDARLEGTAA